MIILPITNKYNQEYKKRVFICFVICTRKTNVNFIFIYYLSADFVVIAADGLFVIIVHFLFIIIVINYFLLEFGLLA